MKEKSLAKVLLNIGLVVKENRQKHQLSQFRLGLEIGKSANQIGRIERAESNPTVETLYKLSTFFKIDLQEFFDIKSGS